MAKLINLTPHTINIVTHEGSYAIPASGNVARVAVKNVPDGVYCFGDENENAAIPVSRTEYGDVEGLPDPEDGTFFIVSMLVGTAAKYRKDLLGPDSGHAIRNEAGQIVGVPGLVRF